MTGVVRVFRQGAALAKSESGILLAIGMLNLAIGLVTAIVLARLLPKAEYGEYLYAFGIASIAALPIELGLPTLMMREIARYRADADGERIAAIIVWVLALLIGSFAIVGTAFWIVVSRGVLPDGIAIPLALWSIALLLPLALMNWARGILQGFEHSIQFALPDSIFRPLLLLAFVVALAALGQIDAVSTMAAHVAAVALCFLWSFARSYAVVRRAGLNWRFPREAVTARAWLSSLLPITLIQGIRIINRRLDIVLMGAFATTAAVAGYNIAIQITGLVLVAQTVLNQRLGPKVAFAHHKGDLERVQSLVAHAAVLSSALALASVAAILLLGHWAIPLVFGREYGEVYLVSAILCAGQLFSGLMGPTALLLNMSRLERKTLRTGFAAMIINVALAALLVPRYHAFGAAIASSATLFIIQSQRWWMVQRHIGVRSDIFAAWRHRRSQSPAKTID